MANAHQKFEKIAIIHQSTAESTQIAEQLRKCFSSVTPENSDLIIVIGGDGSLLHALHNYMGLNIPFYGINSGSVGFLMNNFHIENFFTNIQQAKSTNLYPLKMKAINTKELEKDLTKINNNAISKGIVIDDLKISDGLNEVDLYKKED